MLGILEKISPSELVSNGYISNHNKVRHPCPKFKVSFYLYTCCFWINVTQINFENIKRKIQRIISDSCFQLKLRSNVDARAPSIPLLNFPFKTFAIFKQIYIYCFLIIAVSHVGASISYTKFERVIVNSWPFIISSILWKDPDKNVCTLDC